MKYSQYTYGLKPSINLQTVEQILIRHWSSQYSWSDKPIFKLTDILKYILCKTIIYF